MSNDLPIRIVPSSRVRTIDEVLKDDGSISLLKQLRLVLRRGWEIGESLRAIYKHKPNGNSSYIRARAKHEMLLMEAGRKAKSLAIDLAISGIRPSYNEQVFDPAHYKPRTGMKKSTTKKYEKPVRNALALKTITIEAAVSELNRHGFRYNKSHVMRMLAEKDVSGSLSKGRISSGSLEAWIGTHVPKGSNHLTGWPGKH